VEPPNGVVQGLTPEVMSCCFPEELAGDACGAAIFREVGCGRTQSSATGDYLFVMSEAAAAGGCTCGTTVCRVPSGRTGETAFELADCTRGHRP